MPSLADPQRPGCYRLLEVDEGADGDLTETFEPTTFAASGWGPNMQHGGPVGALLTRAMERFSRPEARISRVSVEILGAVPMSALQVRAWVARPGRRIELLRAEMTAQQPDGGWRPVATALAWQLQTSPTAQAAHLADPPVSVPAPRPNGAALDDSALDDAWRMGFVTALSWQFDAAAAAAGGPTVAWLRLDQPVVAEEEPTDLQRAVAIADVANGVGARLDARIWTYLNTDLSVYLYEPPTGSWLGLAAETSIGQDGIALSQAVLHTGSGPVGRILQNVLVQRRPVPLS